MEISSKEEFVSKTWQTFFKKNDKTVSVRILDDSFIFTITWLSGFFLLYVSTFIVCTDRGRICFKCYVIEKRESSFESAVVENSESSTWNK